MRKKFFPGAVILLLVGVFCLALIGMGRHQVSAQAVDQTAPVLSAGAEGPAPRTSGTASTSKADYVNFPGGLFTTSTLYVDMADMVRSFKISGTAADEVVVMFQAEWVGGTGRAIIRLVIDGVVQPGPGDAASPFAVHEGTEDSTNGFNFISLPLSPGVRHTAKIQWASVYGDIISVDERSMIILHK